MHVKIRLAEIRRQCGIPAAKLPSGTGLTRQTIYAIETDPGQNNTSRTGRLVN